MSKATLTVEYEYLMEEDDSRVRGKTERELWESMTLDYTLTRLMAELERSETLKRLMARQKRAMKALADGDPNHRQWAETELVTIDRELEKAQ